MQNIDPFSKIEASVETEERQFTDEEVAVTKKKRKVANEEGFRNQIRDFAFNFRTRLRIFEVVVFVLLSIAEANCVQQEATAT
ncbi:hypothetical protein AB6A40_003340 [Gnathostoma spinigerum]|uniref:Uncharacterized protein n=1 Tax=Gnathostoma spinigerum TaxID=75299 RepID=A0ABD6EGX5_9BILA